MEWNKIFRSAASSVTAGACIGIAATVYLSLGSPLGPFMFAFGLLGVVYFKLNLFTGKAQFCWSRDRLWLLGVLALNIVGVALVASIANRAGFKIDPAGIVDTRMQTGWLMDGLRAIPCGFIMTLAVKGAADKNFLPLLFGVPTFIFCGFPHCVADVFYYVSVNPLTLLSPEYAATIVGNFLGCNFYRLFTEKTVTYGKLP